MKHLCWQTVLCSEIANFLNPQNVISNAPRLFNNRRVLQNNLYILAKQRQTTNTMEVFSFFFPSLFSHHQRWRHVLAIPNLAHLLLPSPQGRHTCKSKRAKLPTYKILRALHLFSLHLAPLRQMQATGVWYSFLNNIFTYNSHKQTNIDNTKQK